MSVVVTLSLMSMCGVTVQIAGLTLITRFLGFRKASLAKRNNVHKIINPLLILNNTLKLLRCLDNGIVQWFLICPWLLLVSIS